MPAQKLTQPEPARSAFRPTRSAVAVAVGLAIFGWSGLAQSAGLGRLTVQSALGQPLQAEVEVTSVGRDEAPTLSARLASPEQFRTAGLQYNNALSGLQMAVEERGGRHFVKVSSNSPVNEPFVDLLVELNWASGRFVREYTFLLDPPELRASRQTVESSSAAAPAAPIVAATPSTPAVSAEAPLVAQAAARPAAQPTPTAQATQKPATAAAASRPAAGASGRDPAEVAREILAQRDAAAAARSPAPRPPAATADTTRAVEAPAPAAAVAATPAASPAGSDASARSVTVARGETLGQIAARVKPANATLEQTIVAIYQANESAFINGNPNLVREGRTLEIPEGERITAIDSATATRTLNMAARDFRAYKERLAASPAEVQTGDRGTGSTASGSITGQVQDRAQAPATDRLELSRSGAAAGQSGSVGSRDAEAQIARDAALNEANSRVSQLERNVADLQKMLELRNKSLSDLQGQIEQMRASGATVSGSVAASAATAASAAQAEAARAAEAAKAEAAKLESAKVEAAKAAAAKADAAKAEAAKVDAAKADAARAEAAKAEAAKVEAARLAQADAAAKVEAEAKAEADKVEAAKADAARVEAAARADADAATKAAADKEAAARAEADKAAAAARAESNQTTQPATSSATPAARVDAPAPAPEASFVDGLLGNPLLLAGIGGLALLGAGWAWFAMRRRKEERFEDSLVAADAFTSNSLFGTTGGQSVDTTTNTSMSTQITTMSEASPTEVDPIAEADVYIAYGREAQAEEILKEALKRQPERQAIRLKLLEIYSGRKDGHSYELLAREMYDATGGQNEEWNRVASMGASLDPSNPLYSASIGGDSDIGDDASASPHSRDDDLTGPNTASGPTTFTGAGAAAAAAGLASNARAHDAGPETFIDSVPSFEASRIDPPTVVRNEEGADLEFEPTGFNRAEDAAAKARKEFDDALDFASSRSGPPSLLPQVEMPSLDLDSPATQTAELELDQPSLESATTQIGPRTVTETGGAEMDLSSIGLDLDLDRPTRSGPATMTGAGSGQWQEMASKLDLASAYGEIGDKEGARELLQEVLRGGDPSQQQKAKDMLARI